MKVPGAGDDHHDAVEGGAACALDHCQQAFVEFLQVRPAEKQTEQDGNAEAGRQCADPTQAAQTAECSCRDQRQQRADHYPGFAPETLLQRKADGGSGAPTGQQISHRPAGGSTQADQQEASERHVEHAGGHRQHGAQRADEAAYQQAGYAVALKVVLGLHQPLGMVAQASQAANALVIASTEGIGKQVADQSADKAQQKGFPQAQHSAAGEYSNREYQHRARNDQSDYGQTLHAGDDQQRQAQPLRMPGEPLGKGFEPLAHADFLESRSPFDLTKGWWVS